MENRKAETAGKKIKRKLTDRPVPAVILVCIGAVLQVLLGATVGSLLTLPVLKSGNRAVAFSGNYLPFAGIWIVSLLFWRLKKKNRPLLRALGSEARGNAPGRALLPGLILGLGLNLLAAFAAAAHGDIRLTFAGFEPAYCLLLLVSVAVQSGAEELICRVYLYQHLRRIFPKVPAAAILGNALLFSLGHISNDGATALALLNIVLAGILYSLLVYYYDSFWACVIAHTGWNFCQNILLGLPNSGLVSAYSVFRLDTASARNSFAYNTAFGVEGTVFTVVMLAAAVLAVWALGRRRKQKSLDIWAEKETAA